MNQLPPDIRKLLHQWIKGEEKSRAVVEEACRKYAGLFTVHLQEKSYTVNFNKQHFPPLDLSDMSDIAGPLIPHEDAVEA